MVTPASLRLSVMQPYSLFVLCVLLLLLWLVSSRHSRSTMRLGCALRSSAPQPSLRRAWLGAARAMTLMQSVANTGRQTNTEDLVVAALERQIAWRAGVYLLSQHQSETWEDLVTLASLLTQHCETIVLDLRLLLEGAHHHPLPRRVAQVARKEQLIVVLAHFEVLLSDLQGYTGEEPPPELGLEDDRDAYWVRVEAWLERERLRLEERWLTYDLSLD